MILVWFCRVRRGSWSSLSCCLLETFVRWCAAAPPAYKGSPLRTDESTTTPILRTHHIHSQTSVFTEYQASAMPVARVSCWGAILHQGRPKDLYSECANAAEYVQVVCDVRALCFWHQGSSWSDLNGCRPFAFFRLSSLLRSNQNVADPCIGGDLRAHGVADRCYPGSRRQKVQARTTSLKYLAHIHGGHFNLSCLLLRSPLC